MTGQIVAIRGNLQRTDFGEFPVEVGVSREAHSEATKMNITKIAGITLAVLLVAGGTAAALPGDAPTDAPTPNATAADEADANETNDEAAETERGPPADRGPHANDSERGPPVEMPGQAPDFVTEIHETIDQFRSGDLDGELGSAIAELTPDDEQAEDETSGSEEQADAGEQTDANETAES